MNPIIAICLFVLVNAASYLAILLTPIIASMLGLYPKVPEEMVYTLQNWLFGGAFYVLVAGFVVSIGWFFTTGSKRVWLLLAPLYCSLIYSIAVLVYFSLASHTAT